MLMPLCPDFCNDKVTAPLKLHHPVSDRSPSTDFCNDKVTAPLKHQYFLQNTGWGKDFCNDKVTAPLKLAHRQSHLGDPRGFL